MKTNSWLTLSIIAMVGALTVTGCGKNNQQAGVGERTGTALDEASKKGATKAKAAAEAVKDATGKVVEKTGEVLEKAGEAVDTAGENLQK